MAIFECQAPRMSSPGAVTVFLSTDGGYTWWKAQSKLIIHEELTFGPSQGPTASSSESKPKTGTQIYINTTMEKGLETWVEGALETFLDGQSDLAIYPPVSVLTNISAFQHAVSSPSTSPTLSQSFGEERLQISTTLPCILSIIFSKSPEAAIKVNLDQEVRLVIQDRNSKSLHCSRSLCYHDIVNP